MNIPGKSELRHKLSSFAEKNLITAARLVFTDYVLFIFGLWLVITLPGFYKVFPSAFLGVVIGRLFLIGHDACHQSFTASTKLNNWIGRLVFLPSLTPFSLWNVGHNLSHHGFTNLKGKDYVWVPLTLEEYRQLSPARKMLERIYRSGWGTGVYYLIELWWNKMYFPNKRHISSERRIYVQDSWLVTIFGIFWIGLLVWQAYVTAQSPVVLVMTGFILPFFIWNTLMGFIIYIHHTHPSVQWYDDGHKWTAAQPHVTTTVHTKLSFGLGGILHNILEHPAHHLDVRIPLYHLDAAQNKLAELVPGAFVTHTFTWAWYWDCVKRCKFYDYKNGKWETTVEAKSTNPL